MPGPQTPAEADAAVGRRNCVVAAYAFLVPLIAGRVHRGRERIIPIDDLRQAGMLGLLDAATRFDAYARVRIAGAMRDATRKRDFVEAERPRYVEGDFDDVWHRDDLREIAPLPDPVGSPEDFVLLSELWRAIERELSPREARIVQLVVEGQTGPEIGSALGITQQAVSKAHLRAIERLRAKLAA